MSVSLVTGGAGFIGSHLVERLVRDGHRVRVLDNLSTGRLANLEPIQADCEFIAGDILDRELVAKAVAGCEVVYHQAALASVPRSVADPVATHHACATGTLVVLDEARKARVRRVVYAASSSAYGNQPADKKIETQRPAPLSPYATAKLAGEHYCSAFWHSYGLETVALRYFNVFGPRQNPAGPYAAVIPLFANKLLEGVPPTIFGDGLQKRDFTFIENVVSANLLAGAAEAGAGEVFNVGTGHSISVLEVFEKIRTLLESSLEPQFAGPRAGDVRDSLADITKISTTFGYRPLVDLQEGLRRTVEHYAQQGRNSGAGR